MKRYALALVVLTCCVFHTNAQTGNVEDVIHRVADNIIANTSYQFIDTKTRAVAALATELPAGDDIKAQSRYNKWEYANGVMMIGMLKAAGVVGKKEYAGYVYRNFEFVFKNAGYFKEQYTRNPHTEWAPLFRMGALDDCGAMAAALADVVNGGVGDRRYREYLEKVADYILHKQSRLDDGTLCRTFPRKMTIWAEGSGLYDRGEQYLLADTAVGDRREFVCEVASESRV